MNNLSIIIGFDFPFLIILSNFDIFDEYSYSIEWSYIIKQRINYFEEL